MRLMTIAMMSKMVWNASDIKPSDERKKRNRIEKKKRK